MDVIEEKIVKVIEAVSPAMSDIFKKEEDEPQKEA